MALFPIKIKTIKCVYEYQLLALIKSILINLGHIKTSIFIFFLVLFVPVNLWKGYTDFDGNFTGK